MANRPQKGPSPNGQPLFREPEVRRWPHPVSEQPRSLPASARDPDAALYYIHCALSYQNQLLADIKAVLDRLAADPEEK